jgi:hypothetical protein
MYLAVRRSAVIAHADFFASGMVDDRHRYLLCVLATLRKRAACHLERRIRRERCLVDHGLREGLRAGNEGGEREQLHEGFSWSLRYTVRSVTGGRAGTW